MIQIFADFGHWLQAHDLAVQVIVVWIVALSSFAIALAMFTAWLTLRGTRDQTKVGMTLKWQKIAVSTALLANGMYWSMVLVSFYYDWRADFWDRMALMLVFSIGMMTGAVFALLFAYHLRRESRSGREGAIPLAHDTEAGR